MSSSEYDEWMERETLDERAAFNKWKQEYWKSQAEAELKARGKGVGCH